MCWKLQPEKRMENRYMLFWSMGIVHHLETPASPGTQEATVMVIMIANSPERAGPHEATI